MTRLAQQILASRLVLGLSQAELARRAGMRLAYLGGLEQGHPLQPSDAQLLALGAALEVDRLIRRISP